MEESYTAFRILEQGFRALQAELPAHVRDVTIERSEISGNGANGILIGNAAQVVIENVTISGNAQDGVVVQYNVSGFTQITNATFANNGSNGPGGSSCVVTVFFQPTSTGTKAATLRIETNDPDEPFVDVALSGTGIAPDDRPEPQRSRYPPTTLTKPPSLSLWRALAPPTPTV